VEYAILGGSTGAPPPSFRARLVRRLDEIDRVAAEHGLRVIEDAAHAIGTGHTGAWSGATGDLVCFGSGPVKTMTALEGGAILPPRQKEVEVLRQGFRYHLRPSRPRSA
jgi:dTDP-4-amino-4,6-dideoxygalactose transaminase